VDDAANQARGLHLTSRAQFQPFQTFSDRPKPLHAPHVEDAANQSLEILARDSHLTGRPVTTGVALRTLSRPLQVEDAVNQALEIQVRDSHLTGRALLGHVSFPLTRLPPDGALDAWLPVLDAQPITANAKPVGEIHLKLTYKVSFEETPFDLLSFISHHGRLAAYCGLVRACCRRETRWRVLPQAHAQAAHTFSSPCTSQKCAPSCMRHLAAHAVCDC